MRQMERQTHQFYPGLLIVLITALGLYCFTEEVHVSEKMGANVRSVGSTVLVSVDDLFAVLNSHPDENERLMAARTLAWRVQRLDPNQVRWIVSALRSDKSLSVREAVAAAIGTIASQKIYRTGRNRLPYELKVMLTGLRESFRFEQVISVRVAIIKSTSEFDHNESQVILNMGKSDIDPAVRSASYEGERYRENRLRDTGS